MLPVWICWNYPQGRSNRGKDPLSCAYREIREEIGMSAKEMKEIGSFYLAPGYSSEFLYAYLAKGLESAPLPGDADEFIESKPFPLKKPSNLQKAGKSRCKNPGDIDACQGFDLGKINLIQKGFGGAAWSRRGGNGFLRFTMPTTGFRIEHGIQPGYRLRIVIPSPAKVANPGGEIGHRDQLLVKPGKIGDVLQTHNPGLAFGTGHDIFGLIGQ